jgi:tRNA nucleotidyltransferase/poly(A) polymerase
MIIERLPVELKKFLSDVESAGFVLTLVGGIPRDFIFSDQLGHDFDFEIRANVLVSDADWPAYYQKFLELLAQRNIQFKLLPYLITRLDIGRYNLEFSSPRTEKNKEDNFSHHHFDAVLSSNLSYVDSFRRRDFTINAIGIVFDFKNNSDQVVDPYGGVHDLQQGILKNVSSDFFDDSVRFLRFIRFQLKFNNFVPDNNLIADLPRFNLTKLSVHHFCSELFKSNCAGSFLNLFGKLVKENQLKVSGGFKVWTHLTFSPGLKSKEEILGYVFLHDKNAAEKVAKFFSMPEKMLKDIESFSKSYEVVSKVTKEQLKKIQEESDLAVALKSSLLKDLKNLEEKKALRELVHFSETSMLISWKDWQGIQVNAKEMEAIPAPLRSYLPYYKAIQKIKL